MKTLKKFITGGRNIDLNKFNMFPKSKDELIKLLKSLPSEKWNDVDTSKITDMSYLFRDIKLPKHVNLNNWNVSNVKSMAFMFQFSKFNGDISNWNVSNVEDMAFMFQSSDFNGDISNWDVSNVKIMTGMFDSAKFNRDISKWNISNVEDMDGIFAFSDFNQDISNWPEPKPEALKPYNGTGKDFIYYFAIKSKLTPNHQPKWPV